MLAILFLTSQANGLFQLPHIQLGPRENGKSNQLSVVYQTSDDASGYTVRYRQGGDWKNATAGEVRKVETTENPLHFVRSGNLVDLAPGTKVEYEVMKDGTVLFKSSVVSPKSANQDFRFVVFGDCAAGTPQQKEIAFQTTNQTPDMVVITGDIVYGRGRSSEYREKFYPVYNASTASKTTGSGLLNSTLVVGAAGNHDTAGFDTSKTTDGYSYFYYWNQPLNGPLIDAKSATKMTGDNDEVKKKFLAAAGNRFPNAVNFSYDYGNAHYTVLDSNPYVDWNNASMREWVSNDLKSSQATWKFVIFHHPGFQSSDKHKSDKQMRVLHDLFAERGVDVVWQGHVHNYQRNFPMPASGKDPKDKDALKLNDWPLDKEFDGVKMLKPKGVIYITDGAGGAGLYNTDQNDKPETWLPFTSKYHAKHSLSVIDISGKKLTVKHVDVNGVELDRWVIQK